MFCTDEVPIQVSALLLILEMILFLVLLFMLYISCRRKMSQGSHVVQEIVTTEMSYVRDVVEVFEGYFTPLKAQVDILPLSDEHIENIFGNIVEIKEFHGYVSAPCVNMCVTINNNGGI